MPTSMIAIISSDVATGRSMKGADGFMARGGLRPAASAAAAVMELTAMRLEPGVALFGRHLLERGALVGGQMRKHALETRGARIAAGGCSAGARRRDLGGGIGDRDLRAVAQPVRAVDHQRIARFQALRDRDIG